MKRNLLGWSESPLETNEFEEILIWHIVDLVNCVRTNVPARRCLLHIRSDCGAGVCGKSSLWLVMNILTCVRNAQVLTLHSIRSHSFVPNDIYRAIHSAKLSVVSISIHSLRLNAVEDKTAKERMKNMLHEIEWCAQNTKK